MVESNTNFAQIVYLSNEILSAEHINLVDGIDIGSSDRSTAAGTRVRSGSRSQKSNNGRMAMQSGVVQRPIIPAIRRINSCPGKDQCSSDGDVTSLGSLVKSSLSELVWYVDNGLTPAWYSVRVSQKSFYNPAVTVLGSQHQRCATITVLCCQISASAQHIVC